MDTTLKLKGAFEADHMRDKNDKIHHIRLTKDSKPYVNLFSETEFEVGYGVYAFPAGKYNKSDIDSTCLQTENSRHGVTSLIVPKGLVAIFYDRDHFSSEQNGVRVFGEGAYQL